jgi:hypothetical protein
VGGAALALPAGFLLGIIGGNYIYDYIFPLDILRVVMYYWNVSKPPHGAERRSTDPMNEITITLPAIDETIIANLNNLKRWMVTTDASQQEIEAATAEEAIVFFAKEEFPGRTVTGEGDLFTPAELADGAWLRIEAL